MKCAVEMGSGAMIYTSSFIEIDPGIQKLKGKGVRRLHRQHGYLISIFILF
jgi:hypothetical protein